MPLPWADTENYWFNFLSREEVLSARAWVTLTERRFLAMIKPKVRFSAVTLMNPLQGRCFQCQKVRYIYLVGTIAAHLWVCCDCLEEVCQVEFCPTRGKE